MSESASVEPSGAQLRVESFKALVGEIVTVVGSVGLEFKTCAAREVTHAEATVPSSDLASQLSVSPFEKADPKFAETSPGTSVPFFFHLNSEVSESPSASVDPALLQEAESPTR